MTYFIEKKTFKLYFINYTKYMINYFRIQYLYTGGTY